jgi:hypothetical protein
MIPYLEHRRLRRWFGETLDNATSPFEVNLAHLTDVTYQQRAHVYAGNRPYWEIETSLGEYALRFRRGPYAPKLALWAVLQGVNRWVDSGDESPYALSDTHEFFLSKDEAHQRAADRHNFILRLLRDAQPIRAGKTHAP